MIRRLVAAAARAGAVAARGRRTDRPAPVGALLRGGRLRRACSCRDLAGIERVVVGARMSDDARALRGGRRGRRRRVSPAPTRSTASACDAANADAVAAASTRSKGADRAQAAAVMVFSLQRARRWPSRSATTRAALGRLLPGPVTRAACPTPRGASRLACAGRPRRRSACGCPTFRALASGAHAVLQSSANRSGEPDARRLGDVPASIRDGGDLVHRRRRAARHASTVIDLRELRHAGDVVDRPPGRGRRHRRSTCDRNAATSVRSAALWLASQGRSHLRADRRWRRGGRGAGRRGDAARVRRCGCARADGRRWQRGRGRGFRRPRRARSPLVRSAGARRRRSVTRRLGRARSRMCAGGDSGGRGRRVGAPDLRRIGHRARSRCTPA